MELIVALAAPVVAAFSVHRVAAAGGRTRTDAHVDCGRGRACASQVDDCPFMTSL